MKISKYIVGAFLLVGCSTASNTIRLSEETLPKAVMIKVDTIAEIFELTFGQNGISINVSTRPITYLGAGVFISPNGHILSVHHLLESVYPSTITVCNYFGQCSEAEVLAKDPKHDLALFKVDLSVRLDGGAKHPRYFQVPDYARIADPRSLKVGEEVLAVGNPMGLDWTVTKGIISRLNRDLPPDYYNLVQTDTAINPGNSGGPLFNTDGEIVGIVNLGTPGHAGLSFCVDPGQIIEFLTKFRGVTDGLPKLTASYWSLERIFKGK